VALVPSDFKVTDEKLDEQRRVVAVSGEIDLFTAPEFKQCVTDLIEAGASQVVIDLTQTTFLDSTGLGVLIGAVKRLRGRDGELVIVNTDETIAKTFEITGLDQIFTIRSTREQAAAAFAGGAVTS
jgi:anti-sigma B factor antagonist